MYSHNHKIIKKKEKKKCLCLKTFVFVMTIDVSANTSRIACIILLYLFFFLLHQRTNAFEHHLHSGDAYFPISSSLLAASVYRRTFDLGKIGNTELISFHYAEILNLDEVR